MKVKLHLYNDDEYACMIYFMYKTCSYTQHKSYNTTQHGHKKARWL